jgi:hypothetical protein
MLMLAIVVLTALLSSAVTCGAAWWLYQKRLRPAWEQELAAIQAEFETRVKNGVTAAGVDLLPALREQVALGFADALKKSSAV